MSKKINIVYLSHNRTEYSELTFYFLNKIKNINKDIIKISCLYSNKDIINKIKTDIEIDFIHFDNSNINYLNKINYAINQNNLYSIKLDEDCFISNNTWDYIIENIDNLIDDNNIILAPIMSNNIPSCDHFIEDYILDLNIKNKIYDLFLKREMPNGLWGVDYTSLNQYTINNVNNVWNYNEFYDGVNKLNTQTKGIHPIRISYESQVIINEYIINNIEKLINTETFKMYTTKIKSPYFTNSLFVIKTEIWKAIVNSYSYDSYDEISLNKYCKDNNKDILYIKNGYGVHLMFNTVYGNKNIWNIGGENGDIVEQNFFNILKNKIII